MTESEFYQGVLKDRSAKLLWLHSMLQASEHYNTGLVKKESFKSIIENIGISRMTFDRYIKKMSEKGWVRIFDWGIVVVSFRKIIQNSKSNRFKNEKDPVKFKLSIISFLLDENMKCQHFNELKNTVHDEKIRKKAFRCEKKARNYLSRPSISVSCRWFSELCGYKSAMSGHKIEKQLKKAKMVRIKRRFKRLCQLTEYKFRLKNDPSLARKCFVSKDGKFVIQRLTNNIIPNRNMNK